ncbi:MAG TPA: 2OG-Fe(II) oxygenase family protein [Candidatus Nanoarchaeia archaeon]|nr:2OG-Fe(II) oxygenase family protein [Candidatus Nanoarchaeia archaeon]
MNWLSSGFDAGKLRKAFGSSKPFPHVLITDLLVGGRARELAVALQKLEFEEKESDLFHLWQTIDFSSLRKGVLKDFYDFMRGKAFLDFMGKITGMQFSGEIDMAGSLYRDTNFLLCHDDQLEGRKLAFIYYVSEDFSLADGGSLDLFGDKQGHPGGLIKRYPPLFNSLLIFKVSPKSWHAVSEVIGRERYAIGGWLH